MKNKDWTMKEGHRSDTSSSQKKKVPWNHDIGFLINNESL